MTSRSSFWPPLFCDSVIYIVILAHFSCRLNQNILGNGKFKWNLNNYEEKEKGKQTNKQKDKYKREKEDYATKQIRIYFFHNLETFKNHITLEVKNSTNTFRSLNNRIGLLILTNPKFDSSEKLWYIIIERAVKPLGWSYTMHIIQK